MAKTSSRQALATRSNHVSTESKPASLLAEYSSLSYDYSRIAPTRRRIVQDAAVDIKRKQKRLVEDMLAIGRRLAEVKDLLPYGEFGNWIKEEFELSERTAYNMMSAANVYSDEAKLQRVATLSERALFMLAAPSTPQAARDEVEQMLNEGQTLTSAEVEQIIREHRNGVALPAEPLMIEMQAEAPAYDPTIPAIGAGIVGETVVEPVYAPVADLVELVAKEIVVISGKDTDSQLWALDAMARGDRNETLDRIAGWLRREKGIENFRLEDLVEAIKQVAEQKREAKAAREAKRRPTPPSEWQLRAPIDTWLSARGLPLKEQRDLIAALHQQGQAHPDFASLADALPTAWRMRELTPALHSAFERVDEQVGEDEWETRQMPSGQWYACNRGRWRKHRATALFDTEAEALAALDEASNALSDFYRNFEQVLTDEFDGYNVVTTIDQASPELLMEIRAGLEQRVAQGDAPRFVTDRLKRVNDRIEGARRLVEIAETPQPEPAPAMCRVCGCTDERACEDGCWWVEPDLCSQCALAVGYDRVLGRFSIIDAESQPMPFDAWLAAMPANLTLRERLAIFNLAKQAAQDARADEPRLYNAVTNALPNWSQLITALEKLLK